MGIPPINRLLLSLALAASACAQMFPSPGPGTSGSSSAVTETDTLTLGTTYQQVDCIGAASYDRVANASQAQIAFGTGNGQWGLSCLRLYLISDPANASCVDSAESIVSAGGAGIFANDLQNAQYALLYGSSMKIWATSWSVPASMKTTGYCVGSALVGNSTNYTNLATIEASFVTLMSNNGVPIYALSPQNEPDNSTGYPSTIWTGAQFDAFIPYLVTALGNAGFSGTLIMPPEESGYEFGLIATAMADGSVEPDIGVLAGHDYNGVPFPGNLTPGLSPGFTQHVWETEMSDIGGAYDGSITDALKWAHTVFYFFTSIGVNAWHFWALNDVNTGTCPAPECTVDNGDNEGLTDIHGNAAKRGYAIGQYARFVRPGWVRVAVTNNGTMDLSAFKNASTKQWAVVLNNNSANIIEWTVNFSGWTENTAVLPTITDATRNGADQTTISAVSGFTYNIPPYSIVTFSGTSN
jgi:glucuronoarabinoxylan endo-1,4-beta-xylanase